MDEFPEKEDEEILEDSLCGPQGDECPELPAFSGEDYFDDKPIGCCYNQEQQQIWNKWVALKNRVANLEGVYNALKTKKSTVNIDYKVNDKLRGPRGPPGPVGPDGPQGPQGNRAASDSSKLQNLRLQASTTLKTDSKDNQIRILKKQVADEWAAIHDLQARLQTKSHAATPAVSAAAPAQAPSAAKRVQPVKSVTAGTASDTQAKTDAAARLLVDEKRLAADIAAVSADEQHLGLPASSVPTAAASTATDAATKAVDTQEEDGSLDMGTLGSVPSIPLTGENGQDEAAAPLAAVAAAVVPPAAPLAAKAKPAAAPAAAGEEPLDDLPPLGSFDLAR